ncbi:GNAT family N-acetyltransferase [Bacillus massiliglaciei]|uniref:GNAT family N-acetyltransferase n=1 Tax=Bacillus massiliglaciei TaxID=1816693 RepID=UPI000DA63ED2|nr:GNAT family N-acetyltransferase [Bacillus massiliglaciei]
MNQHDAKTETILITEYQEQYLHALHTFYLPEEQKRFTALPEESLELAKREKGRRPFVILAGSQPVGFFVLHDGVEIRPYTANPDAILLRGFLIDYQQQGRKYAGRTMDLLSEVAKKHYPDKEAIVLAVNEKNEAARRLYERAGFVYTGKKKHGRSGWMDIMELRLSSED